MWWLPKINDQCDGYPRIVIVVVCFCFWLFWLFAFSKPRWSRNHCWPNKFPLPLIMAGVCWSWLIETIDHPDPFYLWTQIPLWWTWPGLWFIMSISSTKLWWEQQWYFFQDLGSRDRCVKHWSMSIFGFPKQLFQQDGNLRVVCVFFSANARWWLVIDGENWCGKHTVLTGWSVQLCHSAFSMLLPSTSVYLRNQLPQIPAIRAKRKSEKKQDAHWNRIQFANLSKAKATHYQK